jgi:Sulfotransferase family
LVKILYIAGCGSSGTTLLARLLGEISTFVSVGEAGAYFLGPGDFSRAAIPCGCGAPMAECSLWSALAVDSKLHALGSPFTRSRYLHRALWPNPEARPELPRFLAAAAEFYHDLARLTGATVIVDSSKSPALAALLSQVPAIELHVVHLVRDLRGVVSSGLHAKAYVPATSPQRCILQWYWANLGAELLPPRAARFVRLRYEDFIVHPRPMLEQIASATIGAPVRCFFLGDGQARIQTQHHALGHPDKFQGGEIPLRERKPELGAVLKNVVSLAGVPLLARYGYFSKSRESHSSSSVPLSDLHLRTVHKLKAEPPAI